MTRIDAKAIATCFSVVIDGVVCVVGLAVDFEVVVVLAFKG